MEQRDILQKMHDLAATEEKVAAATVIRTYGSTPRHVGARMIVLEDGSFVGTVGGGCGEAEVWQEAKAVLARGTPAIVHVDLTEDPDEGGEKICGGRMDVLVDLWRRADLVSLGAVLEHLDRGGGMSMSTVLAADAEPRGRRIFVAGDGWYHGSTGDDALDAQIRQAANTFIEGRRSCVASLVDGALLPQSRPRGDGAPQVFVEVLQRPPLLVIAGAGHCALPLARMARMLGFEIVVLDDRPACATHDRFPDASRLLVGDLGNQIAEVPLLPSTYVVLVTRGHKQDEEILRQIVDKPLGYIGMIGSRRRIRAVFDDMERDGFDPALLDGVYSPIGLDICAETPEEIAVSILAEIVRVRNGGTGASLKLRG